MCVPAPPKVIYAEDLIWEKYRQCLSSIIKEIVKERGRDMSKDEIQKKMDNLKHEFHELERLVKEKDKDCCCSDFKYYFKGVPPSRISMVKIKNEWHLRNNSNKLTGNRIFYCPFCGKRIDF